MRSILISKTAQGHLDSIFLYLETKWSIKVKDEFISLLTQKIEFLANFPESGKTCNDFSLIVRSFVINKQVTIYYTFSETEVRLLAIFDTRQDPSKIKKIIS